MTAGGFFIHIHPVTIALFPFSMFIYARHVVK